MDIRLVKARIAIKPEDLAEGRINSASSHPIARAINRRLQPNYRAFVAKTFIEINSLRPFDTVYRNSSNDTLALIRYFDSGMKIEPFTFTFELPARVLNKVRTR